ncbi:hypothetical protein GPALN_010281 [Globodera pallida]|nr:hypothetical protein GPALN_010281 [Globodera pallida]
MLFVAHLRLGQDEAASTTERKHRVVSSTDRPSTAQGTFANAFPVSFSKSVNYYALVKFSAKVGLSLYVGEKFVEVDAPCARCQSLKS